MELSSERLYLRPWREGDAADLYQYASDPAVGPIAGWPVHESVEYSRHCIQTVLNGPECYAICLQGSDDPIGCIELLLNGRTDMTERDDECELGYWLGKPFWGNGYMPEAVRLLLGRAFGALRMTTVWCGYYDGNIKSKRVQEKCGFTYYRTTEGLEVPMLGEVRTGHTNRMTKADWEALQQ